MIKRKSSIQHADIEITSWKMRAYDFYSRVEFSDTYQRVNKIVQSIFHAVICLFHRF